jgi:Calcium-binding EGF domain
VPTVLAENHDGIQDNPSLRLRRNDMACPDGFGGTNCKDDVDECKGSPYPCAGGTKHGSFCVDHNPPEKFKCGCLPGFNAVLPNAMDVKDPVPVEWRPLKCIPRDVCVDVVCHEDATCIVSSSNTAVCVCNDNLVGDGITTCAPAPKKTVATKPPSPQSATCNVDSDCTKLENAVCVKGSCKCKAGFYQSNGKGQCMNENECAAGYPNDCHKNAVCADTEGSYMCACKDGYQDLNPKDKPGTRCAQINECLSPALHNCNLETQVCLDRPPPMKWQCVERTPAPTPAPTCYDADVRFITRITYPDDSYHDWGPDNCKWFQELTPHWEAEYGSGGGFCNCEAGTYNAFYYQPPTTVELISVNRKAGTTVGNLCCYCQGRQEDACFVTYLGDE